ncbi:rhodanese-like domain-containing protein [Candidatus Micrarchaeota archaeon]|nr:rhodanese-like domain-containing protein [Candidatus Micrarchaeota archaeon]
MKNWIAFIAVAALFGALAGAGTTMLFEKNSFKEYYSVENAVHVSPHDFVEAKKKGDSSTLLVDLRSKGEYEAKHLAGAVNIPATSMTKQEVLDAFNSLPKDKEIIVHCYASSCMLGRQVGKFLSENNFYVKELTVGWAELNRDYSDYLVSGSEAGLIPISEETAVCNGESFSC